MRSLVLAQAIPRRSEHAPTSLWPHGHCLNVPGDRHDFSGMVLLPDSGMAADNESPQFVLAGPHGQLLDSTGLGGMPGLADLPSCDDLSDLALVSRIDPADWRVRSFEETVL